MAPEVKILVTSREPLHLTAERRFPLNPLYLCALQSSTMESQPLFSLVAPTVSIRLSLFHPLSGRHPIHY